MHTTLTLLHLQDQVDGALAGVTGGPGLPRHGVGRVTVSTERLTIHPRLGDGIGSLSLVKTEHLGNGTSGGHLDQDDVVQTDLVVRVLQGQHTLNLVGLDHGLQDVLDSRDLAVAEVAAGTVGSSNPVSHSQDTTHVVRGVTPFSSQPAVIVVQPTDHGTNVESTVDGVQLVRSSGNASTVGDDSAFDRGAQQLGALLELQGLQSTTDGIEEHQTGRVKLDTYTVSFVKPFIISNSK